VVEDNLQQGLHGGDFLEKPFLPEELARKVREMLSRTNGKVEAEDSLSANSCSEQLSDELDSGMIHG
jgi:DNA-binding response OmpR family regulator